MQMRLLAIGIASLFLCTSCEYLRLLRPSVLKQLNVRVVRLVNELPNVDEPNKAIIARLFAHGGLSRAKVGSDGVQYDTIRVPVNQLIWEPAIIKMHHGGDLVLQFSNEDQAHHMAFVPNDGERVVLDLPSHTRGEVRVRLSQPGLYWFGCPVANHAGRGMLGLIIVPGEVADTAKLDRPPQERP